MERRPTPESPVLTVGFVSLGCAKNLVDSQIMAGVLLSEGLRLAPVPEEADIVLVNTCAFIDEAREESRATIRAACRLKAEGACRAVIVTGCLPQRYRARLRREWPAVDAFLGVDELERVGEIAREILAGRGGRVEVTAVPTRLFEPRRPAPVFSNGAYAYLKVAEGCDHPCAFCAIPGIRGRYRSRPVAALVGEAEQLLAQGFRELDLISQDVTAYGRDLRDGTDLAALLRALGRLGGAFWIRLLYGYPSGVTDALLAAMGEVPQVCRYLDLPVQHSHPDLLRAMRRGGTVAAVDGLAARLRTALPGIALRTTCLVGFPGETEVHFAHLAAYIEASDFDHVGAFVYSAEEGTAAAALPGRPARRVAERRRERLLELQRRNVDRRSAARVGTEDEVRLDRPAGAGAGAAWLARSARQAPEVDGAVWVAGVAGEARRGALVRVRYTAAADYDMKAAALGPPQG